MAQTQLGLDAMNPDKAAPAFVVKPVDLARPPSRSGSYQRSGSRVLKHHCRADISYMFFHLVHSEKTKIYFNFYYMENVLTHSRMPQGWSSSPAMARSAMDLTFADAILRRFLKKEKL